MAAAFPYVHISCPCNDENAPSATVTASTPLQASYNRPQSRDHTGTQNTDGTIEDDNNDDEDEEGNPFDPRDPRSAFSLFLIENLLYCEDCHQIRCPRCVQDEIVCYFCPSCLFEVPSSSVKTDGNRCTRNCFQCPICSTLLSITSKATPAASTEAPTGPFALSCNHCHWTTTELDPPIQFEKPTSLSSQLTKLAPISNESEFARLKQHYAQQLGNAQEDFSGSPGTLTRLMGLYTGIGSGSHGRKAKGIRKMEMREIDRVVEIDNRKDLEIVEKLARIGFHETPSTKQKRLQVTPPSFLSDLRPSAVFLRTKRSKRCRACRHILVKPESKVQTTRFRIRLVAPNYIPRISIKRLDQTIQYSNLVPHKTHRFILTVENPLFDQISVSLLTPSYINTGTRSTDITTTTITTTTTPSATEKSVGQDAPSTPTKGSGAGGSLLRNALEHNVPQHVQARVYNSRVTILCPEFDVGANTDVWDEALLTSQSSGGAPSADKEPPGTPSLSGAAKAATSEVYDRGRNFTCVVIEVVPPEVLDDKETNDFDFRLVEIPVLVRVTYETEVEREDASAAAGGAAGGTSATSASAAAVAGEKTGSTGRGGGGGLGQMMKEKMEYSYWCVIGIGRIGDPVEGVVESAPNTPAKGTSWANSTPVGTPIRKPSMV